MTQNNVGALVVVKPGEVKSLAGIITERGNNLEIRCLFTHNQGLELSSLVFGIYLNLNLRGNS